MPWWKQAWYNQILKKPSWNEIVSSEDSIKCFKSILNSVDWNLITQASTSDSSYNIFLDKFPKLYDIAFPERKIELKQKDLPSPWITRGLKKISKRKQRLYQKFLKRRNDQNEKVYKTFLRELVRKTKIIIQKTNNIKTMLKVNEKSCRL